MSGNGPIRGVLRFGVFEMDLEQRELRRSGLRVRLQDQPFQLLVALLERPGRIVTREELRSKLWPVDTFVDFDHSLNASIKRLRDALGESAESPIFVETVARRGYRFIGNVVEVPALLSSDRAVSKSVTTRGWWLLGAAAAVISLLAFVVVTNIDALRHQNIETNRVIGSAAAREPFP